MGQKSSKVPQHHQAQMKFLKKNTKFTKAEIGKMYKTFMRIFPTGKISRNEFIPLCERILKNYKELARDIYRVFDRNKDGFVDFEEFIFTIHFVTRGTREQKLELLFLLCDINGNGTIDKKEMIQTFEMGYDFCTSSERNSRWKIRFERLYLQNFAKKMFRKLDVDRSKTLTLPEFITGCMEDPNMQRFLETWEDEFNDPSAAVKQILVKI